MGFDYIDIQHAYTGKETLEEMVETLTSSPKSKLVSIEETRSIQVLVDQGYPYKDSLDALRATHFVTDRAEALVQDRLNRKKMQKEGLINNFYLALVEYLGERLRNYMHYCISCHAPHNCCTREGVVCPSPLCVFRWQEFALDDVIPSHQVLR